MQSLYIDFLKEYTDIKCSLESFRKIISDDLNISFTKLGNEECEHCVAHEIHQKIHNQENNECGNAFENKIEELTATSEKLSSVELDDEENVISTDEEQVEKLVGDQNENVEKICTEEKCRECLKWKKHMLQASQARENYRLDGDSDKLSNSNLCFSVDLQKVIMLPRMNGIKKVLFTKRIIAFNESFVPVGKKQKNLKPHAVIWAEPIAGRKKEDITSTFHAFLLNNRDAECITLWLDNCAGQNKNWALLSFLIYIVNSNEIAAKEIVFKYFEPGHTFMSADSFHHQVEKSMESMHNVYDFNDFQKAVQSANSGKVKVINMKFENFSEWKDYSSQYKLQKMKPRVYLHDIVMIKAQRGKRILYYTNSFTSPFKELNFLNSKMLKNIPKASRCAQPRGIPEEKKKSIISELCSLMPENRRQYWMELPSRNDVHDLVTDFE